MTSTIQKKKLPGTLTVGILSARSASLLYSIRKNFWTAPPADSNTTLRSDPICSAKTSSFYSLPAIRRKFVETMSFVVFMTNPTSFTAKQTTSIYALSAFPSTLAIIS